MPITGAGKMITEEQVHAGNTSDGAGWVPLEDPPPRRLSPVRVAVFLLVLAGLCAGAISLITHRTPSAAAARRAAPWFAPYVDVTLTPTYPFQSPAANPVSRVFLGFVVSRSASAPCTPSWGGYYSLTSAQTALDLDERIAQLRTQGATPMVSFGGAANTELAVSCQSVPALERAYLAPIERYHATAIDLDVEGTNLADRSADTRRAQAVAGVEESRAAAQAPLGVWLTLPVSTSGLTPDGVAAVRAMVAAHVALTGINVLAMDFAAGQGAGHGMFTAVQRALYAAHAQVRSLLRSAAHPLSSAGAWQHLGVTVMIGRNDVAGEQFTLGDARRLAAFVAAQGIARVSAWSLNRDSECGSVFSQVGVLSDSCSGVVQSPLQFTRILSQLPGTDVARATGTSSSTLPQVQPTAVDNPADSPYPVWQPGLAYNAGFKVVWHRQIYQARWWSQGSAPDASASGQSTAPWLLIGPVPAGSRAPKPVLLDTGVHPAWSPNAIYRQGAVITFDGLPYRAKWYTHADQPSSILPADPQLPWEPLFNWPGEPAGTAG